MAALICDQSPDASTGFEYQTLNRVDREDLWIRLIDLQPSLHSADDIHCDIHHVSLQSKPEYEALSYCWGNVQTTETIFLHGRPFNAGLNLVSALRFLRREDRPRTIWIDAISINQLDINERGHQVAFMGRIYASAKCDLLWLGEDPLGQAVSAFQTVEHIRSHLARVNRTSSPSLQALRELEKSLAEVTTPENLKSLRAIFRDRAVWSRIWIVQELTMAPRITIHAGGQSISWAVVEEVLGLLTAFRNPLKPPYNTIMDFDIAFLKLNAINTVREEYQYDDQKWTILQLWDSFQRLDATDPRDKLFALVGLASDADICIRPNYTETAATIFTKFMKYLITGTQSLDCLSIGHIPLESVISPKSQLPTWVPNFASTSLHARLYTQPGHIQYSASGSSKINLDFNWNTSDLGVLNVPGILLDTISTVYSPVKKQSSWADFESMVSEIPDIILEADYHTNEHGFTSCARTLLADTAFLNRRLDGSGFSDARSLLLQLRRRADGKPTSVTLLAYRQLESLWGFRFSTSLKGWMCMVPDLAQEGDVMAVLYGSKIPFLLRPVDKEGDDCYQFIGMCYVHGFMDGEAVEWREQGRLVEKVFHLT